MSYDAEVLADAPLSYWKFEDDNLDSCAPTVGAMALTVPAGNTHAEGMQGGQESSAWSRRSVAGRPERQPFGD